MGIRVVQTPGDVFEAEYWRIVDRLAAGNDDPDLAEVNHAIVAAGTTIAQLERDVATRRQELNTEENPAGAVIQLGSSSPRRAGISGKGR
jgi:hypothetical protein